MDLPAANGEKRYRQTTVRGLIHTFCRYKSTITENTSLDQEMALDPELFGRVFENLLAAYIPETATTTRKHTGSFYTPREIVDYMVDETLIADQTPSPPPSAFSLQPPAFHSGIRPLPNLETKFVVTNTWIGIEKPAQQI